MIVLFTDFGLEGPYTGQVKAVLHRLAPGVPVIDLLADAPTHDPRPAAYLLAAYVAEFPAGSAFVCVVDPGVGSRRPALLLDADGRWFVGPDNGLFEPLLRRSARIRCWHLAEPPGRVSATFHGRDVFAPAAARLAAGGSPAAIGAVPAQPIRRDDWPDDLAAIVYVDRFGNLMTGLRAAVVDPAASLVVGGVAVAHARTYSDVPAGAAFWYENANGLAEIAVNRDRADRVLAAAVGTTVSPLLTD